MARPTDNDGNLFVSGPGTSNIRLAELQHGGSELKRVSFKLNTTNGTVVWDGGSLALSYYKTPDRQFRFYLSRFQVSNYAAKVTGTYHLDSGKKELFQTVFWN
jgi:hypothetical protein